MKRVKFLIMSFLCILTLVISGGLPAYANPVSQSIPTTIAGYPVIFVQTSGNTYGLATNEVILTLFDKTPTLEDNPVSRQKVLEYLQDNPLPPGWSIEVYGGPNATKAEFERIHKENYDRNKKDSLTASTSPLMAGTRTRTADKNVDPSYSYNAVTYQSAWWSAPSVTANNQDIGSYLLNNVQTNTGFFLQSGQRYYSTGGGENVYTDTNWLYLPKNFHVGYVVGHNYRFAIGYVGPGSPSLWFMSCTDLTGYVYDDVYDNNASGYQLSYGLNTSIWFENMNRYQYWWGAFNPYVIPVNWANEVLNGQISPWHEDLVEIRDSSGQNVYNNGIITGSNGVYLANYNTAQWHFDKIPYVH